jgi:transposase
VRQQIVELHMAGRTPAELSREFGVSAQSITNWVARKPRPTPASLLPGKDGLSSAERDELARLRREVRQLKLERDILAKATAWFAGKNEQDVPRVFELVKANQADAQKRLRCARCAACWACRPAGSTTGLGASPRRASAPTTTLVADIRIRAELHADSAPTACPRMRAELRAQGQHVNAKRVARLMREAGIRGVSRRRGFT